MKNNAELRASMVRVIAHVDSLPKTDDDWQLIETHLAASLAYAAKVRRMRAALAAKLSNQDAKS